MSDDNPHAIQQVPFHSEMWGCGVVSTAVDKLQKVSHNLFMRCEACLQAEGGHFQHLL
jgi:N-acetylmuramoyl-L-alanine amidase CwlA